METLTFQKIRPDGTTVGAPMAVKYAPAELTLAKSAQYAEIAIPGLELPLLQFVRGDAITLSMELFFDSTDGGTGAQATAVTDEVEQFQKLVAIDGDLHHPPLVKITWGRNFPGSRFGDSDQAGTTFTAVVLSVSRKFMLFNPDGAPLRAMVTLSLKQFATIAQQVQAINYRSADHTRIHVVQQGEDLPLIAHDAYGDARKWRDIARHNQLSDARSLAAGLTLQLPPTK